MFGGVAVMVCWFACVGVLGLRCTLFRLTLVGFSLVLVAFGDCELCVLDLFCVCCYFVYL